MKHIDIETISTYMGGDKHVLDNFLQLVKRELLKSLHDLENQYQLRDLQAFKEAGHKLKGTALSGGLPILASLMTGFSGLTAFDEVAIGKMMQNLHNEIMEIIAILDSGNY